jgi:hypothetical protein
MRPKGFAVNHGNAGEMHETVFISNESACMAGDSAAMAKTWARETTHTSILV